MAASSQPKTRKRSQPENKSKVFRNAALGLKHQRGVSIEGVPFVLIETTQSFETKEDAEDNLQGIKNLPGFLFGYVRQPSQPNQKNDVVHVFDCTGDTRNLRKQRAITSYELNEEAMYNFYRQLQQF